MEAYEKQTSDWKVAVMESHFLVDREGLAKLMARRPKGYVVLELLQNAWDEKISRVSLDLNYERGIATIVVKDDSAEGFADLSHAYTLFAESRKKADPTKRGRFNIGEKLVIAICENSEIRTMKGTVRFDREGRHHSRSHTDYGTIFTGRLKMTQAEYAEMVIAALLVIPPAGIKTCFNGKALPERKLLASFEVQLPTEVADANGYLRSLWRKTTVEVYQPLDEVENPQLYEMGIPVVGTGDTWHVNIMQKVPLNSDRDNITPSYLRHVRTAMLNRMAAQLDEEASTATWVNEALADKWIEPEAVRQVIEQRFGPKRVVTDPSDREAEKRAVAAGYTVIPARAFSAEQWKNIRQAEAALPAGRVTPSPKPFSTDGKPPRLVPQEKWPTGVLEVVERLQELAERITDGPVGIIITNDRSWRFDAACGPNRKLYINVARVGWVFFDAVGCAQLRLLIHELAHIKVSDHLSEEYADELCYLGARLALVMKGD